MTKHLPEDERRRQILDAARTCFIQDGYAQTRMDQIAREAHLSKGGLYFHFKSKRELFLALVEQEYGYAMHFFRNIRHSEQTPRAKLEALVSFFMKMFATHPEFHRFFIVMGEMALRDETIRDHLTKLQLDYVGVMSEIIVEGISAGVFRPVDPHMVAELLKAFVDGVEGRMILGEVPDIDKLVESTLDLVASGIVLTNGAA